MKVRKSIILIILTIFLFSIASVTAANTTDVMTSNDDSSQKNEIISKNPTKIHQIFTFFKFRHCEYWC